MQKYLHKNRWLVALTLTSTLIIIVFLSVKKENTISDYLEAETLRVEKKFESVSDSLNKIAINTFYGIINKKEIITIFKNAHHSNEFEQSAIRKTLYKKLKKDFRRIRMLGVRQIHFHLPDTRSFLRMHKPSRFGDKLETIRPTVKYVATNHIEIEGFDEGVMMSGFRYVYPLFQDSNSYIGSVEISFDTYAPIVAYEQAFESHATVIFKKRLLDDTLSSSQERSSEHPDYFYAQSYKSRANYNDVTSMDAKTLHGLSSSIDRGIQSEKAFTLYHENSNGVKIASFLPLKNVITTEISGYVVIYSQDRFIHAVLMQYRIGVAITLILALLFYFIVSRELRYKKSLEDKVEERTLELNKLYQHEHYLKELLNTIAEVNESLISSFSLGSIIESSVDRLSRHENFKLITYDAIDGNHLLPQYVRGDTYELLKYEMIDIEKPEEVPIMTSAIEAVVTNSVAINNKLDLGELDVSYNRRDNDYQIRSSISFLLHEPDCDAPYAVVTLFSTQTAYDNEEIALLENLMHDIAMALSANKQKMLAEKLQLKQISNYEETILAFVDMIEQRDAYTAGHTIRVAEYSRLIAEAYGIDEKKINTIEKAAILHDIGKISTPDTILLKPGKLSFLEYSLIQSHVDAGVRMLSKIELYKDLSELIQYHHERFDGKGYPNHIKGENIPIEGHILIVADAFDAMTTNRIYKARKSVDEALDEILAQAGKQFHPEIAKVAVHTLRGMEIKHTSQLPQNELEQQRFSYFFKDNLTSLYNENYLQLITHGSESFHCLYKINIQNFTEFNHTNGWKAGNAFLISFGEFLQEQFKTSLIFRYQGDDFIVLSKEHVVINEAAFNDFMREYPLITHNSEHHEYSMRIDLEKFFY